MEQPDIDRLDWMEIALKLYHRLPSEMHPTARDMADIRAYLANGGKV